MQGVYNVTGVKQQGAIIPFSRFAGTQHYSPSSFYNVLVVSESEIELLSKGYTQK